MKINIGALARLALMSTAALILGVVRGEESVKVVPASTAGHQGRAPYDTWQNAATNLSLAVTYAANNGIAQVLVSNGWYLLTATVNDNKGIHIRSFNEGDLDREGTVIDGNQGRGFHLSHVNSVLEGFTITNCSLMKSSGGSAVLLSGGGMVRNCDFVGNTGSRNSSYEGGTLRLTNGGIALDCRFIDNEFSGYGGAINSRQGDTLISNCYFSGNSGWDSGGAISVVDGHTEILDCYFTNNISRRGGAFHTHPRDGCTVLIDRSVFVGNIATNTGGGGSSARGGGALQIAAPSADVTVRNSLIMHNTSPNTYGGAINFYSNQSSSIENCTIVSNYTYGASGAITVRPGNYTNAVIKNTIVAFNRNDGGQEPNITGEATKLTWYNNCLGTSLDLDNRGTNNLYNIDPGFSNPGSHDWRLQPTSPCIDQGLTTKAMLKETALDGTMRVMGQAVDIGCYEADGIGKTGNRLTMAGFATSVVVLPAFTPAKSAPNRTAANLLIEHLREISGVTLDLKLENQLDLSIENGRIKALDAPDIETFILVGEGGLATSLNIDSEGLGSAGIRLRDIANAVVLIGMIDDIDSRGPTYASIKFLETLGCRYLWPGDLGKVMPHSPTIVVDNLDHDFTPPVSQRAMRWSSTRLSSVENGLDFLQLDPDAWLQRVNDSLATTSDCGWTLWHGLGGSLGITGGHNGAGTKLSPDWYQVLTEEHPEWFALQSDGTRSYLERYRLCKSNTNLINWVADGIIDYFAANPTRTSVSLSPNDGGYSSFCTCPECEALDPPEAPMVNFTIYAKQGSSTRTYIPHPALSDRMVWYWNQIAERVGQVYPQLLFVVDAYSIYKTAPVREVPHPNLVARYVSVDKDEWQAWTDQGLQGIFWRPNLFGSANGRLHLKTPMIADFFPFAASNGNLATDIDSIGDQWALTGFDYYLTARLTWDPYQQLEDILDDYCHMGFGAGAEYIKTYLRSIFELGSAELYDNETMVFLRSCLANAAQATASDEAIQERIAFLRTGLNYHEVQTALLRLVAEVDAGNPYDQMYAQRLLNLNYVMMRDIALHPKFGMTVKTPAIIQGTSNLAYLQKIKGRDFRAGESLLDRSSGITLTGREDSLSDLFALYGFGQVVCVVPPETPGHQATEPYNTWENATTNISMAVTFACDNGIPEVLVSNGWYKLDKTVDNTRGVRIRSFNNGVIDREGTIIDGNGMRGFQMSSPIALLEGFTVTNCNVTASAGGSAVLVTAGGTVRHCGFIANTGSRKNSYQGGTVRFDGGGTLLDCRFVDNDISGYGGAVNCYKGDTFIRDCFFSGNKGWDNGGAIAVVNGYTEIIDCYFTNNISRCGGGFSSIPSTGCEVLIDRCVFVGNIATNTGGSGSSARGGGALQISNSKADVTLRNSLLMHNSSPNTYGGAINLYSAPNSLIDNCTIVANYSSSSHGAITVRDGEFTNVVIRNTIIDGNRNKNNSNPNVSDGQKIVWTNNCVGTSLDLNAYGAGNLLNVNPGFVNPAGDNWRLVEDAPCVNAGFSEPWMSRTRDLDRRQRLRYQVDIGCYEFPHQVGTIIMYP